MTIGKWIAITAALAMVPLTSCRKTSPATSASTSLPQPTVAHVEPERVLTKDEQSCKEFVQYFYDWYIHDSLAAYCTKSPDHQDCKEAGEFHSHGEMSRKIALSPKLKRLLDEDSAAAAKEEGVGYLEVDPYLASQDPSPKFRVESVQVKNDRCDALVYGLRDGTKQEKVMPELARLRGRWMFVNFRYDESDDLVSGLTGDLKYLRDEAKSAKR